MMETAVLIIEDNPVDIHMICNALRQDQTWRTIVIVQNDGEKGMHYLLHQGDHIATVKPDLLILDLNLPKCSGAEILRAVRTDQSLSELPVVVLSSSPEDVIREVVSRSTVHADLYLTKPTSVKEYMALGKRFRECYECASQSRRRRH